MCNANRECGGNTCGSVTCPPLNELPGFVFAVGFVAALGLESADSEPGSGGVGSVREGFARIFLALLTRGSEDGGDGQKGGDEEFGTEEHREGNGGGLEVESAVDREVGSGGMKGS